MVYTVAMYSKLVSFIPFNFSFLYDTCFMPRMAQVLFYYSVQDIFEYYSATTCAIKRGATSISNFIWIEKRKKCEALLIGPSSNYLLPRVRLTAIKVQNLGLISVISHSIPCLSSRYDIGDFLRGLIDDYKSFHQQKLIKLGICTKSQYTLQVMIPLF